MSTNNEKYPWQCPRVEPEIAYFVQPTVQNLNDCTSLRKSRKSSHFRSWNQWMFGFFCVNPSSCQEISLWTRKVNLRVPLVEKSGSPKSVGFILWGPWIDRELHSNPSNSCWDISFLTKVVDKQTLTLLSLDLCRWQGWTNPRCLNCTPPYSLTLEMITSASLTWVFVYVCVCVFCVKIFMSSDGSCSQTSTTC